MDRLLEIKVKGNSSDQCHQVVLYVLDISFEKINIVSLLKRITSL